MSTDNNPPIFYEFAAYKLTIQNRSKLTVEQYLFDLTKFFMFIKAARAGIKPDSEEYEKIDISDVDVAFCKTITKKDIYAYMTYVATDRDNQARARARKLSSLRSFFKYLTGRMNYFTEDPTANIEGPSIKPSLPKYLTEDEAILLLEAVENDKESKTTIRDYCILTLFLNCGMRLSELCGIDLKNLDPSLRSVLVVGKGSKERIIYLNDACKAALSAWLLHRGLIEIKDKNALFISSRGTRISRTMVQTIVYKYLEAAGLGNRKMSVHKLRHTAATLMYQTGKVDVRLLKDILGHEQLNTTQIYTHVSNEGMERAMQENPLSELRRKGAHADTADNDNDDE